jgi:hypothetical protein
MVYRRDVVTDSVASTITGYRAAAERGDAEAVAEMLADDVVFNSPLTARVRFQGRDEVAALHRDIFAILDGLVTTEPLTLGDTRAFIFHAQVRGIDLEAIVHARGNEQGQIAELTIFGRPLPALATLFATLPPRVSARRRGAATGALVASLTRPLAAVLHAADRMAPRFL